MVSVLCALALKSLRAVGETGVSKHVDLDAKMRGVAVVTKTAFAV